MRIQAAFLAGLAVWGQQPEYFKEKKARWWVPTYEIEAGHDKLVFDPDNRPTLTRDRVRLRLRWTIGGDSDWWQIRAGSVHRTGSDGNRNNLVRSDNEPSNGSGLDLAEVRLRVLGAQGGAEIHGGLVQNELIHQESLYDPDHRILGAGGRLFWRHEASGLDELGLRAVVGTVQLMQGGEVRIRAVQGVLKFTTGPVTWTATAGPWRLEARQEDAAKFRWQNPGAPDGLYPDPVFSFDTIGAGLLWAGDIPLEARALRHKNKATGDKGEELQVWLGSSTKPWWPRVGYVRQLLPPGGALASVNGDLWWHHANADGERYVLQLPMPKKWTLSYSVVDQRRRNVALPATLGFKRTMIGLAKRF